MPRPRLIAAFLVVGLIAASCGGDDATSPDDPGRSEPEVIAPDGASLAPELGDPAPGDPAPDGASLAPELGDPAPDTAAAPAAVSEFVRVELGDRFEWCARIQERWDAHFDASIAAAAASETLAGAVAAHAVATDELDKAEATAVLEDARREYNYARKGVDGQAESAIRPLLQSADPEVAERPDTESIALARAWEAFVSQASPEEVALVMQPSLNGVDELSYIVYDEVDAWYGEVWEDWREWFVGYIDAEEAEPLGVDGLNEAATATAAAAAEFGAMAVSLEAQAATARVALRDALVVASDARDAAAVSDAVAAAVAAQELALDMLLAAGKARVAAGFVVNATSSLRHIVAAADEAGIAGVDSGPLEAAEASSADAAAALKTLLALHRSLGLDHQYFDEGVVYVEAVALADTEWSTPQLAPLQDVLIDAERLAEWETFPPELGPSPDPRAVADLIQEEVHHYLAPAQVIRPLRNVAYDAVLVHSAAHAAFARSLGESCR